MQMLVTASKLDWSGWLRGVFGSLISGGAGAVSSAFGVMTLDKNHDINIFALMGITFAFSGIVSMAKFLQNSPVPNVWDGTDRRGANIEPKGTHE